MSETEVESTTVDEILPPPEAIDVVFSFDTTGSMNQCIRQVRRDVQNTVTTLFTRIPNIRIGLIAHGDYGDERTKYVIKKCDLTRDVLTLINFINNEATDTCGYDWEECYELVLRDSQQLSWKDNAIKRLVMIGDAVPHEKNKNPFSIDWKEEAGKLKDMDISVYSVHCMNDMKSKKFFSDLATLTTGMYMQLRNFDSIVSLISAICYQQNGQEQLQQYEEELNTNGQMTREVRGMIDIIAGRAPTEGSSDTPEIPAAMDAVDPGRFQICPVGDAKISIKQFVLDQGLPFKVGRGFYEMTKKEKVTDKKEIVLRSNLGDFYSGLRAKEIAKDVLSTGKPDVLPDYKVYVQSNSYNRILMPDTTFLYEMEHS